MYNIDFELCALGMLLLVLLHSHIENTLRTFSNRLFLVFAVCGLFNILLDLLSSVMICHHESYTLAAQWLVLLLLYLLQLAVPYLLYAYVLSLRNSIRRRNLPFLLAVSAPFLFFAAAVLTDPFTHILFWFDGAGIYHRGLWYPLMFAHAVFYLGLAVLDATIHRKRIARRYVWVIWEFVIISCILVAVQLRFPDILLGGVGISLALTVMLLTFNNPKDRLDALTGLFGMNALQDALTECQQDSRGCVYPVIIALDNLKRINLVFGVEPCNELLNHDAQQFVALVGQENAFRFLGDQFVLLCHTPAEYVEVWDGVGAIFERPYTLRGTQIHITACVCGIPHPEVYSSPRQLLDFIDYLVGQAKKSGAGSRLVATERIIGEYRRHKEIEAFLYEAVEHNLFEVYYQPLYDTQEKCFVSAEALVRLRHPIYGMLSPAEFIPIAESSGEIVRVEQAIFSQICHFLQANPGLNGRLRNIKCNISPASFLSPSLAAQQLETLLACGLDPRFFQFEITETAATIYNSELTEWVRSIKKAGCGLCLDDFGSGYANLDAVTRLPFDVIKLDRSLLASAMKDRQSAVLYTHIAGAMVGLGFNLVAEGAETPDDIAFLCARGIRYIQGFFYARPMSERQLLELLDLPCVSASAPAADTAG